MPLLRCVAMLAATLSTAAPPPVTEASPGRPPDREGTHDPAGSPSAHAPTSTYTLEDARRDLETVRTDRSLAYVHARARLAEHPNLAVRAVGERLGAATEGAAVDPSLAAVLADLDTRGAAAALASHWGTVLAQDPAATALERAHAIRRVAAGMSAHGPAVLAALAGDRRLPSEVRAVFVTALVRSLPASAAADLMPLLAGRDPLLRGTLRRAIVTRVRHDPAFRKAWNEATRRALELPPSARAQVLLVGAAQTSPPPELLARAVGWARTAGVPFEVRVSAVRLLARHGGEADRRGLAPLVTAAARDGATRRDELLARYALDAVPPAEARKLVEAHALWRHRDPALAAAALARVPPPPEEALRLLHEAPWPEIRATVLSGIAAPCGAETIQAAARAARPAHRGGDPSDRVARAALLALGRCGGPRSARAVYRVLRDRSTKPVRRADAVRVAVTAFGPDGVGEAVAAVEDTTEERTLARLLDALAAAPAGDPRAIRAACTVAERPGPAGRAGRRTLARLGGGPEDCR